MPNRRQHQPAAAATQAPAKQAASGHDRARRGRKAAADTACGELKMEDFTNAKIDWKAPATAAPGGEITIHVAALSHPYINALRPYVPLFTELTGINVVYDILPVEEFWTKTAADLQGGTGFYDLIQNGTEFEWAYSEAGWTEDLNKFLNDPKLTDLAWYDVKDFYPADWDAHAWNGQYGIGTYGKGQQNAIPVNSEPLMLICNKDKLAKAGLSGAAQDLGRVGRGCQEDDGQRRVRRGAARRARLQPDVRLRPWLLRLLQDVTSTRTASQSTTAPSA